MVIWEGAPFKSCKEWSDWVVEGYRSGRLPRQRQASQFLIQHTRTFLRKYIIVNNCRDSEFWPGVRVFEAPVGWRPGSVPKTQRMYSAVAYIIQRRPPLGWNQDANAYDNWSVWGIPTGESNVAPEWHLLPDRLEPIMLTTRLAGHTFVARWAAGRPAGRVEVTQLRPKQESGIALNTRMKVPGQRAYGPLKYDAGTRLVNVIGVRRGGSWKFYTQKIDKYSHTILSVTRIFPPE